MTKVLKCPVCIGNGIVPKGYYSAIRQEDGALMWSTSSIESETCKSCDGKGYVVVTEGHD